MLPGIDDPSTVGVMHALGREHIAGRLSRQRLVRCALAAVGVVEGHLPEASRADLRVVWAWAEDRATMSEVLGARGRLWKRWTAAAAYAADAADAAASASAAYAAASAAAYAAAYAAYTDAVRRAIIVQYLADEVRARIDADTAQVDDVLRRSDPEEIIARHGTDDERAAMWSAAHENGEHR